MSMALLALVPAILVSLAFANLKTWIGCIYLFFAVVVIVVTTVLFILFIKMRCRRGRGWWTAIVKTVSLLEPDSLLVPLTGNLVAGVAIAGIVSVLSSGHVNWIILIFAFFLYLLANIAISIVRSLKYKKEDAP